MPHETPEREATFQRGIEAYRAGLHYEAHEIWEGIWEDEEDPDRRRFLQALIQITSAVHKLMNDVGPKGAPFLLERALGRLEGLPSDYAGVDVVRLREGAGRLRDHLAAGGISSIEETRAPLLERAGPIASGSAVDWRGRAPSIGPDPRQQLAAGIATYRRRAFYEAHEIWEIVWREEQNPTLKSFLQGLILVAAAMHKLHTQKSPAGAIRLLDKARERLEKVPEATGGMGIGALLDGIRRARVAVSVIAPDDAPFLSDEVLPPMQEHRAG